MKFILSGILALGLGLGLAGCQSSGATRNNAIVGVGTPAGTSPIRLSGAAAEAPGDPRYAGLMANVTTLTFNRTHGPQVSYYAPGGRIILWYPGNEILLTGEWKGLPSAHECFRYGTNTYNPATRTGGGVWECQHLALVSGLLGTQQIERKGDVFGLAKRSKPPFVTRKDEAQWRELFTKMPPQTADDRPSRKSRYMRERSAAQIAANDQKIWQQVGTPPPDPNATQAPQEPKAPSEE